MTSARRTKRKRSCQYERTQPKYDPPTTNEHKKKNDQVNMIDQKTVDQRNTNKQKRNDQPRTNEKKKRSA